MASIYNFEKGEKLATGFVRPKVTALFFDKIWIPASLLDTSFQYFAIPNEVLIKEENELTIPYVNNPLSGDFYRMAEFKQEVGYFCELNQQFYSAKKHHQNNNNSIPKSFQPEDSFDFEKKEKYSPFITRKFKYSHNRNNAILVNSKRFEEQYRIRAYPIFHDLTEFEQNALLLDIEESYKIGGVNSQQNTFSNDTVLSVCIQDFPTIDEDELSWEQVIDLRKDKNRIQQLKQFTTWATRVQANKTPLEIQEMLASELEEYKSALREHGIKTTVGTFSAIVSNASAISSLFSKNSSLLLPILSIASVTIGFSANLYFSNRKIKNHPLAYFYNITD